MNREDSRKVRMYTEDCMCAFVTRKTPKIKIKQHSTAHIQKMIIIQTCHLQCSLLSWMKDTEVEVFFLKMTLKYFYHVV